MTIVDGVIRTYKISAVTIYNTKKLIMLVTGDKTSHAD